MSRFTSMLGRGRAAAGGTPVLHALATLADPAVRQIFEGDARPRAVADRDLRLVCHSMALARLLGPHTAMPATLADLLLPAAAASGVQAVEAAMVRATPSATKLATAIVAAGGTACRVELSIAPIVEADGQVSGAVLTLDPTPEAATGEVQARKLQAIGALAGGVAHDFNNLLQAIIGAGESLADRQGLADDAREDVTMILGGARRGAALVRQLLAFAGQQTLQPRVVAVNSAVAALAPLLRRSLGERVQLQVELDEPGRFVTVDPGQLDQVLVNLSINARDAMPNGGTLVLRTGRRTLLAAQPGGVEAIPAGRYVMLEVQDTGTGIAPEVLPRIFEPFFTTRHDRGSGLGLSTVLGIVRQSAGFLEVESTAGQGSVFRILLPRSAAPAAAAPPLPKAAESRPAEGGLVLLVEDEDAIRRLAQRALERQGWRVLAADCGESALALLTPDAALCCVVTDMVMPGIDGATLAQEVRARLGRPTLPAIIVSGYAEVPLHGAIDASATAFLPKPYSLRDLAARVAAVARPTAVYRDSPVPSREPVA